MFVLTLVAVRRLFRDVFARQVYIPIVRTIRTGVTFPDVETPICRGPSRCVERRENVQFVGESAQLMGIRNRLHSDEIQFTWD